jgi:hypothetical protein
MTTADPTRESLSIKEIAARVKQQGFTFASYARAIRRSRSGVTDVVDGRRGGELRARFLKKFGFTDDEIPLRLRRQTGRARSRQIATNNPVEQSGKQHGFSS